MVRLRLYVSPPSQLIANVPLAILRIAAFATDCKWFACDSACRCLCNWLQMFRLRLLYVAAFATDCKWFACDSACRCLCNWLQMFRLRFCVSLHLQLIANVSPTAIYAAAFATDCKCFAYDYCMSLPLQLITIVYQLALLPARRMLLLKIYATMNGARIGFARKPGSRRVRDQISRGKRRYVSA